MRAGDSRTLLIELTNRPGERIVIEIDESLANGGFYDLGETDPRLQPGARYSATLGSRKLIFNVDAKAKTGKRACRQPAAALHARLSARHRARMDIARLDAARLRAAFAALLIALAATLVAASPALDRLRGLSIDILTALRWRIFGNAHPPATSAAVVVALDEETFRTPPFDGTPERHLDALRSARC